MTIAPAPVEEPWPASGNRPGFAMMPDWMRYWSEPEESPMFRAESVTFESRVMMFVPEILNVRLAISPMPSGMPTSPVQLAELIQEYSPVSGLELADVQLRFAARAGLGVGDSEERRGDHQRGARKQGTRLRTFHLNRFGEATGG
jgi:hypothetical protein